MDRSKYFLRADGVYAIPGAAGTGGGGGEEPAAHAETHEPGGSDELESAAWTDVANTFLTDQTIDGDLFVTGTITPLTAEQRAKINALVGDPTGARTLMSSSFVSGLSLRHDEDLGLGRVACGNYDTQTYQPLLFEVESFQVHSGVSPAARVEHLRVHPSGGVTIGEGQDHATDPGLGIIKARGLDGTPLPLHAATHAPGGSDPLAIPVPPLPPYYDYGEGTPANPAADTVRLYAVDDSGFTFLEERDAAGRIIRTSRDTVAVGKVDEPGGIVRGQCVYVSGASGSNRLLKKAIATSRTTTPAFGVAMETGAQNAFIRILTSGLLAAFDTSAIPEGTRVFLSETTPGALTVTPPLAPNLTQRVGWVLRQHAVQGEIGVLPSTALSESSWAAVHASMHAAGGRDPVTIAQSQVTGLTAILPASGQVKFPSTQNPSSDATTLDDYREGTWTPILLGINSNSGQTYNTTNTTGRYVKIGKQVCCYGRLNLSVKGTFSGNIVLGALPFTMDSSVPANINSTMHFGYWGNLATPIVTLTGLIVPNTTYAALYGATGATGSLVPLAESFLASNTDLIFSATYPATA